MKAKMSKTSKTSKTVSGGVGAETAKAGKVAGVGRPDGAPQVSAELVKGTLLPVVLALLKDGPRYGYEMVRTVNARTNGALEWTEGALYPVLHKLETDGLVAAEWRDASSAQMGGRRRRYYTLTSAGRRELTRRAAEWKTFSAAVGEFFASAVRQLPGMDRPPASAAAGPASVQSDGLPCDVAMIGGAR
jgi:DNA-binding PadR family transcriptional regulator